MDFGNTAMNDENRYIRQMILPEFGENGQAKLASAHVLVIGAGGLGCPALQYLVAAGIGRITIVDADTVSRTNLHRQTLYREGDIGRNKAEAARDTLCRLNPDTDIVAVVQRMDAANITKLLEGVDIAMDCADSFAVSYALSDACLEAKTPLSSASALGFSGYTGGFCGNAPSLRALFPDLPDRAANCSTAGVMGPVVGMLGCLQAQMVLSHLLELEPSPLGQCITLDCRSFHVSSFRFDKAPEPDGTVLRFIAPSQIEPDDFVVELRDSMEAPVPATHNAHRYQVADFGPDGPRPENGQRAVLCCRSGLRSWQAAQRLMPVWNGDIALIAMGDQEQQPTG